MLREALVTSANDIIPKENGQRRKNKWITNENLDMIQMGWKTMLRQKTTQTNMEQMQTA